MKAIADRTTVVLAGSFNPAILQPNWVAVNALDHPAGQEFQVEMLAPIGGQGATRYTFDGLSYSAGFKSFIWHLDGAQLACQRSINALASILGLLPHTPVAGLGFNFAFVVDEPSAALLTLMTGHDGMADTFPGAPEVVVRRWGNTVTWEQALVGVDCELAGGKATITFNFHYATASANEARQILMTADVFATHQLRAQLAAVALSGQPLEV